MEDEVIKSMQKLVVSLFEENNKLREQLKGKPASNTVHNENSNNTNNEDILHYKSEIEKYKRLLQKYNEWCPEIAKEDNKEEVKEVKEKNIVIEPENTKKEEKKIIKVKKR